MLSLVLGDCKGKKLSVSGLLEMDGKRDKENPTADTMGEEQQNRS